MVIWNQPVTIARYQLCSARSGQKNLKRDLFSLHVIFEDNHLLVLNKPAGIATMGGLSGEVSLWQQAKDYIKCKYDKPGEVYLGIVSRLDRSVSGLIVFARTSKAAARMNEQFHDRQVRKVYWALVPDRESLPSSGELEHWLSKSESQQKMLVVDANEPGAQQARLRYRTLERRSGRSGGRHLEIELLTGRKHQIRVQLSAAGVPIWGDRKYGSRHSYPEGIALHSQSLSLRHPTLKTLFSWECAPPKSWQIAWNQIA